MNWCATLEASQGKVGREIKQPVQGGKQTYDLQNGEATAESEHIGQLKENPLLITLLSSYCHLIATCLDSDIQCLKW